MARARPVSWRGAGCSLSRRTKDRNDTNESAPICYSVRAAERYDIQLHRGGARSACAPVAGGGWNEAPKSVNQTGLMDKNGAIGKPGKLWLLLDDRPGHTTQVLGIAEALGWPYEQKQLHFQAWNHIPNNFLGASLFTLDRKRSDPLEPPWPDLVIAMGRRTAPIARWIRERSDGRCKLVQLGRKGANMSGSFDLAIACRHFQLPPHPQRLDLVLPPSQVTSDRLAEAATRWTELYSGAAVPRVVLLVGGDTIMHALPPQEAGSLAAKALAFAREAGGSLTVVTSRRTGEAAITAMRDAAEGARFHIWRRGERENPYLGYLAGADVLVATGESESMLAEAVATGRPLFIYPLPERPRSMKLRLKHWVFASSRSSGVVGRACQRAIVDGWLDPPRDIDLFHRELIEAELAKPFGASLETGSRSPGWPEGRLVASRIRDVMGMSSKDFS